MYEVKLTLENGTAWSRTFDDYETMVAWLATEPPAGMMVWKDDEDIGTERFIQVQNDVEALQA